MKLKKMVKQIYRNSNILVVNGYGNELFKGFAYELRQKILRNEFDNHKLITIREEYNEEANLVLIKIYVE